MTASGFRIGKWGVLALAWRYLPRRLRRVALGVLAGAGLAVALAVVGIVLLVQRVA